MLLTIVALSVITFAFRAAGSVFPAFGAAIATRTRGLAPALLAAFVVGELTGTRNWPVLDAKAAGVAAAVVLAACRLPLAVSVVGGAAVAALLRSVGVD